MTEEQELEAFHQGLLLAVKEKSSELSAMKQEAFTYLLLEDLVEIGTINDFEVCHMRKRLGRGIAKVNGYSIAETEGRVDLFTSIFRAEPEVTTLSAAEVRDAYSQAARVFSFAKSTRYEEMDPASSERLMFERLHNAFEDFTSLRIILLTNAKVPSLAKAPEVGSLEVTAQPECYDLVRYFRWKNSSTTHESIQIDLRDYSCGPIPCLKMPDGDADYGAYMAIFPGQLLFEIYEEYGARLMELNVRSYLQNRGKVNKGIRETIMTEPNRFLAYNNGISATAESLECERTSDGMVINRLYGFQVVNGGQTCASIHRAAKADKADLSGVFVQTKISVVPEELVETLVPRISRYANTQNTVNEADFSSNNPFHVEMEQISRKTWVPGESSRWFYERARGQYDVLRSREGRTPAQRAKFDQQNPKRQRVSKTDLAKYVMSWGQQPHIVSMGAQKCFVRYMAALEGQPSTWAPDPSFYKDCVAKAIVFKAAESLARKHGFPAYRANAICYTVAKFANAFDGKFDLAGVWDNQAVSESTTAWIEEAMPVIYNAIIESANGRNVTEWAKKEGCWKAVEGAAIPAPESFKGA
jgi:hypothetical protein